MGDRTNLTLRLISSDADIRGAARELFENYSGGDHFEDTDEDSNLNLGANDVSCGSASELDFDLAQLIHERGSEFAYQVHEDPAYEWLGQVCIHVPGLLPDLTAECDADGSPVLTTTTVTSALAIADDAAMREFLMLQSGQTHRDAMVEYATNHTGATVAPDVSPANGEDDER